MQAPAAMERRVAANVLLMLWLVAGCLSAATADVDTIRLPSQDDVAKAGEKRPWKCCNRAMCTRSIPPFCRCLDVLQHCPGACKDCREAEREQESDPKGVVCHNVYRGYPGPTCSSADDKVDVVVDAADEVVMTAVAAAEEKRPWKCCDDTLCDRSAPPKCRCLDTVDHCAGECKRCEPAESDPSRRVCRDRYKGWPGPRCNDDDDDPVVTPNSVAVP